MLGVGGKNVEKVVDPLGWVPQSHLCVAHGATHRVEPLCCVSRCLLLLLLLLLLGSSWLRLLVLCCRRRGWLGRALRLPLLPLLLLLCRLLLLQLPLLPPLLPGSPRRLGQRDSLVRFHPEGKRGVQGWTWRAVAVCTAVRGSENYAQL